MREQQLVYSGQLAASLDGGELGADEADRLERYRTRHGITHAEHRDALVSIGWDVAQYEAAVAAAAELDAYCGLVEAAVSGGRVPEAEATRLDAYRTKHGVTAAMHASALAKLSLRPESYGARPAVARSADVVEEYAALLRRELDAPHAADDVELRVLEYRASAGVDDACHEAALRLLGLRADEYEARRVANLGERLLAQREANGAAHASLVELEDALKEARAVERAATDGGGAAALSAEAEALDEALAASAAELASLRQQMGAREARLGVVQEMLDAREAQLYEAEEAVRAEESLLAERAREKKALQAKLDELDARAAAQRRALGLLVAESETGSAGARPAAPDDAELAELVQRAELARRERADYVAFHTVCMGTKLALAPDAARLRNVRIDELWTEAQRRRIPPADWRPFIRQRLVRPTANAHGASLARPAHALRAVGDEVGAAAGEVLRALDEWCGVKAALAHAGSNAEVGGDTNGARSANPAEPATVAAHDRGGA